MDRTGMFLPRSWEAWWRSLGLRLSRVTWVRAVQLAGLYAVALALTIGAAHVLRSHVIDSLQIDAATAHVTVFLAPVSPQARAAVADLLDDAVLPGNIAYVAPSSWRIPELGFSGTKWSYQGGGLDELLHPTTHGNSLLFNEDRLSVLLVEATSDAGDLQGSAQFTHALAIRPIEFAVLDLVAGELVERRPAAAGHWVGIPVPTF
ncbi:MAG: hypothetical protein ACR2P1_18365 [Pseudomonadales bacterium]